MKAITVRQPWAGMIFGFWWGRARDETKTIENRQWQTHYRGPLLIHAASRSEPELPPDRAARLDHPSAALASIVGIVDLVGVYTVEYDDHFWALADHYHWLLENPRLLDEPIPYVGRQSIYTVREPEVLASVTRQLGESVTAQTG